VVDRAGVGQQLFLDYSTLKILEMTLMKRRHVPQSSVKLCMKSKQYSFLHSGGLWLAYNKDDVLNKT